MITAAIAYRQGKLPGSDDTATAPALPSDYTKTAKTAAERRIASAGYRLAEEIKALAL